MLTAITKGFQTLFNQGMILNLLCLIRDGNPIQILIILPPHKTPLPLFITATLIFTKISNHKPISHNHHLPKTTLLAKAQT